MMNLLGWFFGAGRKLTFFAKADDPKPLIGSQSAGLKGDPMKIGDCDESFYVGDGNQVRFFDEVLYDGCNKPVEPSRERHVRRLAADIAIARAGSGIERVNAKFEAEHCLDVARRIINGEIAS